MKSESLVKLNRCERPSRFFRRSLLTVALALVVPIGLKADLSIETETARMLGVGKIEFSAAGEYQFSKEGGEFALPFAYELGIHPRLALLIEPTPCVWISHKHQPMIRGVGDTEVTATYLLKTETENLPAFAFAGEVKLPTAHNRGIGTGRVDYAVYLVASKRFGPMDVHANIAYTFVGKPPGASVQNSTSFALAAELPLSPFTDCFTE